MDADVNAYDGGTDTGPAFTSENMPQEEREAIFSFGGVKPAGASIFYNPSECAIFFLCMSWCECDTVLFGGGGW